MTSFHDDISFSPQDSAPRKRSASRDDAVASDAESIDAGSPTLSRWYRTTTPEPGDRARHLQSIAEAIAAARSGASAHSVHSPTDANADATPDDAAAALQVRTREGLQAHNSAPVREAVEAFARSPATPIPTLQAHHAAPAPARARRAVSRVSRSPWARAAVLVTFAAGGLALLARGHRSPGLSPDAASMRDVGFALRLPDATVRNVSLAGDFNGWDASTLPMIRDPSDGTWRVRIPLAPGRHTYSYVIDGTRWVIDPLAPRTVEGALGPANVIAVMGDT